MGDVPGTKVWVGNLGSTCEERDLRDEFSKFGELNKVWVARNPPGFAFVWFADDRDASDAVREVDGRSIAGREWRVEIVWVARNPPGFAFVWFADERDAGDAVREIDGRSIGGREWRVEISHQRGRDRGPPGGGGGGGGYGGGSPPRGRSRSPPGRGRSPYGRSRSRSPPRGDRY